MAFKIDFSKVQCGKFRFRWPFPSHLAAVFLSRNVVCGGGGGEYLCREGDCEKHWAGSFAASHLVGALFLWFRCSELFWGRICRRLLRPIVTSCTCNSQNERWRYVHSAIIVADNRASAFALLRWSRAIEGRGSVYRTPPLYIPDSPWHSGYSCTPGPLTTNFLASSVDPGLSLTWEVYATFKDWSGPV